MSHGSEASRGLCDDPRDGRARGALASIAGHVDPLFVVGYALTWATCVACLSGSLSLDLLGPIALPDAHGNPSHFFAAALVCTAVGHLVWAGALALAHPSSHVLRLVAWVAGGGAGFGILLAAVMPPTVGVAPTVLIGALCGMATSLLDVLWLQLAGRLAPKVTGPSIPLAICLGCCVALALSALDALTAALALALAVALPPASAGLLAHRSATTPVAWPFPTGRRAGLVGARQACGILWRPIAAMLVLYIVFGFGLNVVGYAANADGGPMAMTGRVAVASELIVTLALAWRSCADGRLSVGATYAVALVAFVLGVCLLPIAVQLQDPTAALCVASVPIGVGGTVCDALALGMVAHAAYDYRLPGGVVCGVTRGAMLVVSACGALIGNELVTGGYVGRHLGVIVFAQVAIVLMVVTAALFLGRRRIAVLLDEGQPRTQTSTHAATGPATSPLGASGRQPASSDHSAASPVSVASTPPVGAASQARAAEVLAPNPTEVGPRHAAGAATGESPLQTASTTVLIQAGDGPDVPLWLSGERGGEDRATESAHEFERRLAFLADAHELTPRERDVLGLMARGRSMPYMAQELVLSESTVHSHVQRIYRKLGVHNRQDLIDLVESTDARA